MALRGGFVGVYSAGVLCIYSKQSDMWGFCVFGGLVFYPHHLLAGSGDVFTDCSFFCGGGGGEGLLFNHGFLPPS